jgi:hypothetical protein
VIAILNTGAHEANIKIMSKCETMFLIFITTCIMQRTAQQLVLAAAAARARHLRLKTTLLARGASLEAAKPLSAANGVGWLLGTPDSLPENQNHCRLDKIIAQTLAFCNNPKA